LKYSLQPGVCRLDGHTLLKYSVHIPSSRPLRSAFMTSSHILMGCHQAGARTDLFSLELRHSLQNLPLVSSLLGHSLQDHPPSSSVQHAPGQSGVCGLSWQLGSEVQFEGTIDGCAVEIDGGVEGDSDGGAVGLFVGMISSGVRSASCSGLPDGDVGAGVGESVVEEGLTLGCFDG